MPKSTVALSGLPLHYVRANSFAVSTKHQRRAHEVIPGAAHTYAKGDDQYPQHMAPVIDRGEGCRVWDVDGNEFIEFGAGLRSVGLGHGYRPVCDAAYAAMLHGTNFARPARLELEAAEQLLALLPAADMVKFAKNGSDATTAAVKIARAWTGRDMVACCTDQPFFSSDDWFIGATAMNSGIPESTRAMTLGFRYNDLPGLEALFEAHPNQIAAIIMEAQTTTLPEPGYLAAVVETCRRHGALLILDEIISGFRFANGGAQTLHGIDPDLSTFGKAMGNGLSVSALAGKRRYMELGGLRHLDRERCFLLSQTHGAESPGLAAAIEVIKTYEREDVIGHMAHMGTRLADALNAKAAEMGIADYFGVRGHPAALIYYTCDPDKQRSQGYRTLFLQETIRRGLIAPNLVVNFAHRESDIDYAVEAIGEALEVYRRALSDGLDDYLESRPVAPVLRKMNLPA